jgi:hypothetical protein
MEPFAIDLPSKNSLSTKGHFAVLSDRGDVRKMRFAAQELNSAISSITIKSADRISFAWNVWRPMLEQKLPTITSPIPSLKNECKIVRPDFEPR